MARFTASAKKARPAYCKRAAKPRSWRPTSWTIRSSPARSHRAGRFSFVPISICIASGSKSFTVSGSQGAVRARNGKQEPLPPFLSLRTMMEGKERAMSTPQDQLRAFDANLPLACARTIPSAWYFDPDIYALERRAVFGGSWQYAARLDQLRDPGAVVTIDIAGEPILVVRDEQGVL